jgi:hypothetical protein
MEFTLLNLKLKLFGYLPALPVVFFTLKQYNKKGGRISPTASKGKTVTLYQTSFSDPPT